MEEKQVEVVICKKCGDALAVCSIPYCYTDAEWRKDISKYAKDGYEIKQVGRKDYKMCECNVKVRKDASQKTLF